MRAATLDTPPLDASMPPGLDAPRPANPSHEPSTLDTQTLSTTDYALLRALADPAASPAAVAEAHDLDLPTLALWFARPHIQHAIAAMRALNEHSDALWRREARKEAVEMLREVARTTDEHVERRRAASAILRALHAPTLPRAHDQSRAGPDRPPPPARDDGAPHDLEARRPYFDPFKAFVRVPAIAGLANDESDPLSPQQLADLDRGARATVPESWREDPACLIDRIADRLARLPHPTPERVELAVCDAAHIDLYRSKGMRKPFIQSIVDSPLLIPHHDTHWSRTTHRLHACRDEAWRTFSWRHPDGRVRRSTVTLRYDNGDDGRSVPRKWALFSIENSEARDPLAPQHGTNSPSHHARPPPAQSHRHPLPRNSPDPPARARPPPSSTPSLLQTPLGSFLVPLDFQDSPYPRA